MSNEITVLDWKSTTNLAVHRAIVDNSAPDLWISCGQLGSREILAKKNEEKEAEGAFPYHLRHVDSHFLSSVDSSRRTIRPTMRQCL